MKIIGVNTKLIGLLGYPLGQSLSPFAQNQVYNALGLDYYYFPIELQDEASLAAVVQAIRHMNFAGFAATKPFKVTILSYLDEVEETAARMGSCNTVVCQNGKLVGHNTDGIGAITDFQREGINIEGASFLSFGAGGTGRSVCLELAKHGAKRIVLVSRSAACETLADNINQYFPGVCTAIRAARQATVEDAVAAADVVMNLSGLGMAPGLDQTPVRAGAFKAGQFCFDATYNPAETQFLKDAKAAGCRTLNGFGMMAFQGTRQIALWAGVEEPVEEMLHFVQLAHSEREMIKG